MEVNGNNWLCLSVFAKKSDWHFLLMVAIKPILTLLEQKGELISFKVCFSHFGGENIGIALLVKRSMATRVAKEVDFLFKDFFRRHDLIPVLKEGPFESVFMPYPQNTVQYGLFSTNDYNSQLSEALSRTMIDGLAEDKIDDEMLLTFSVYILFLCYKAMMPAEVNIVEYYSACTAAVEQNIETYDLFKSKHNELNLTLREIFNDLDQPFNKNGLHWLSHWNIAYLNALAGATNCFEQLTLLKKTEGLLKEQLGLNDFSHGLLKYFLHQIIVQTRHETQRA